MPDDDDFDGPESDRRKREGMALAAENKKKLLEHARQVARSIAEKNPNRECSADLVGRVLKEEGIILGPAAGSLFKTKDWKNTGRWIKSKRKTNHSRTIWIWQLVA